MNIHNASLFPDLIGAAKHCNELTRERMARNHTATEEKSLPTAKPPVTSPQKASGVAGVVATVLINVQGDRSGISEAQARNVALEFEKFLDTEAGVDWFIRQSQLARSRTWLRRKLLKMDYPDELAREATLGAVAAAAKLVRKADGDD